MLETPWEKEPAEECVREGLGLKLKQLFGQDMTGGTLTDPTQEALYDRLQKVALRIYEEREATCGAERLRSAERFVVLWILDKYWKEHLYALDNLREGIGLRSWGQKDPLVEYKRESFDMFEQMLDGMKNEMVQLLFRLTEAPPKDGESGGAATMGPVPKPRAPMASKKLTYGREFVTPAGAPRFRSAPEPPQKIVPRTVSDADRVGRNDPCPCGSGKKFKHCCMNKIA